MASEHEQTAEFTSPDSSVAIDDADFRQRLVSALTTRAMPLFQETARHAVENGLSVTVELLTEAGESRPRLVLTAQHPDDGLASSYSIIGDLENRSIVHEEVYAEPPATNRQNALLPSINEKVIDTRLATFFNKAFALSLPHILDRHPAGFW